MQYIWRKYGEHETRGQVFLADPGTGDLAICLQRLGRVHYGNILGGIAMSSDRAMAYIEKFTQAAADAIWSEHLNEQQRREVEMEEYRQKRLRESLEAESRRIEERQRQSDEFHKRLADREENKAEETAKAEAKLLEKQERTARKEREKSESAEQIRRYLEIGINLRRERESRETEDEKKKRDTPIDDANAIHHVFVSHSGNDGFVRMSVNGRSRRVLVPLFAKMTPEEKAAKIEGAAIRLKRDCILDGTHNRRFRNQVATGPKTPICDRQYHGGQFNTGEW